MIAIFPVIKQTLLITLFVLAMMLIIEYLNVMTKGLWSKGIKKNKLQQVLLGSSLGVIPGCLGAYTAVSLYIHDIIGTGGLVATMIATSGDEAFAMFSLFPEKALLLNLIIFVIALASGVLIDRFFKRNLLGKSHKNHMHIHEVPECAGFNLKTSWNQVRHMRPTRALMLVSILFFVTFIFMDQYISGGSLYQLIHLGQKGAGDEADPLWIKVTFFIVISLSTIVILIVNDHFLEKHLWGHIIKKHFSKIFFWTFFTLVGVAFLMKYFDLSQLIHQNLILVLIAAVLIGIIPESGPHLIFVLLFANGALPFSILLASSIVQDGHGSLPLLAESRKAFVVVKLLNMAVGLLIGLAGLALGI
jgi:hypothetical protein